MKWRADQSVIPTPDFGERLDTPYGLDGRDYVAAAKRAEGAR